MRGASSCEAWHARSDRVRNGASALAMGCRSGWPPMLPRMHHAHGQHEQALPGRTRTHACTRPGGAPGARQASRQPGVAAAPRTCELPGQTPVTASCTHLAVLSADAGSRKCVRGRVHGRRICTPVLHSVSSRQNAFSPGPARPIARPKVPPSRKCVFPH